MTTIAEVAGALTAAAGLTRDLLAINKTVAEAEFKLKIAELNTALAAAQIGLVNLQKELASRDKIIADLKSAFAIKDGLIEVYGFKYKKRNGKPIGGAFCPRCEIESGQFMPLTMSAKPGRIFVCPKCTSEYTRGPTYYSDA